MYFRVFNYTTKIKKLDNFLIKYMVKNNLVRLGNHVFVKYTDLLSQRMWLKNYVFDEISLSVNTLV